MANPRGSRALSADPFSPPTVEKRVSILVFLPTPLSMSMVVCAESRLSALLTFPFQHSKNTYNVADIVGHLKLAVGTRTLGVDHALGDALAVEVCQQDNEVKVLQQQRAVGAHALRGLGVHDRATIGSGIDRSLVVAVGLCRKKKEREQLYSRR